MRTVAAIMGRRSPNYPAAFGLEIELEHVDYSRANGFRDYWRTTGDGSLRNGIEFVSLPLNFDNAVAAAERLEQSLREYEISYRCGTHIHMSVDALTADELARLLAAYALCEPYLMDLAGEERQDNVFCVPYFTTPNQYKFLEEIGAGWREGDRVRLETAIGMLPRSGCKYSALNLGRMSDLGTVEFRMIPAWRGAATVTEWLPRLDNLRAFAASNDTMSAKELFTMYEDMDSKAFAEMVLGEELSPVDQCHTYDAEVIAAMCCGADILTVDEIDWVGAMLWSEAPEEEQEPEEEPEYDYDPDYDVRVEEGLDTIWSDRDIPLGELVDMFRNNRLGRPVPLQNIRMTGDSD